MKKLILFIGFGLFLNSYNSFAQTCNHGVKTAEAKTCAKPSEAALKAASMDASIETKVCAKNGNVCFMKKTVDASGASAMVEVKYDEATASFVNMPAGENEMINSKNGKSCSASKACCAKGAASGKACCKAKGTAAAVKSENVAPSPSEKSE